MGKQTSCHQADVGSSKSAGGAHLQKSRLLSAVSGLAGRLEENSQNYPVTGF